MALSQSVCLGGEGTYGELLEVFEIAGLKMLDQIEHRMTQFVFHSNSFPQYAISNSLMNPANS